MFLKGHQCAGHVAILFLQERRGRSGAGARVQRDVAGHDHHDVAGQGPSLAQDSAHFFSPLGAKQEMPRGCGSKPSWDPILG